MNSDYIRSNTVKKKHILKYVLKKKIRRMLWIDCSHGLQKILISAIKKHLSINCYVSGIEPRWHNAKIINRRVHFAGICSFTEETDFKANMYEAMWRELLEVYIMGAWGRCCLNETTLELRLKRELCQANRRQAHMPWAWSHYFCSFITWEI